ncbi:MAG: phosphopantetheine-binding protein, partial [Gammaproteobacteria bacterium]|nr:phosphopantetheine-binding protein [Gammaproteobacteria bacterium]
LPTPAVEDSSIGVQEPPANPAEIAIAEIWTNLIQPIRPIGRNDIFFEIGGHSLMALRALNQMEQYFGVGLDLRVLFRSNLAEIASQLQETKSSDDIARVAGS